MNHFSEEQPNNVSESVIRKIQLLFELANQKTGHDGASNENEALAAMAKAQELLAKYNLDLAVVQSARVAGGTAEKDEQREKVTSSRTAMYKWQVKLCKAICEANFCWHWVVERTDEYQISGGAQRKHKRARRVKRHVVLGRVANTTVAIMMYEYLVDTIERLLPYPGPERLSRDANSWREGCADRLIERIQRKAQEMKTASRKADTATQSTALAVRTLHETEYAANYDAAYGEGAYARSKVREARWEAEDAAEAEERRKQLAAETPEERAAREKKEAAAEEQRRKEAERYWKRKDREEEREANRRNYSAYYSGREKAEDIGLDSQLNANKRKEIK